MAPLATGLFGMNRRRLGRRRRRRSQPYTAFLAEFRRGRVGEAAIRTGILKGGAAFDAKFCGRLVFGIAARTAHFQNAQVRTGQPYHDLKPDVCLVRALSQR
jgi:hypothetical protein